MGFLKDITTGIGSAGKAFMRDAKIADHTAKSQNTMADGLFKLASLVKSKRQIKSIPNKRA